MAAGEFTGPLPGRGIHAFACDCVGEPAWVWRPSAARMPREPLPV